MVANGVAAIVTAYCLCALCTGHTHGITKSGVRARVGHTIACDPKMLGAVVETPWGLRVCEDTGSAIRGNRIDLFVKTHDQAKKFGVRIAKVRMLGKISLDEIRKGR